MCIFVLGYDASERCEENRKFKYCQLMNMASTAIKHMYICVT